MKLCRFELLESPGQARSGMVYGSNVYETDGANPIGTHPWNEVRLLSPVGLPPSIRVYEPPDEDANWETGAETALPEFQYVNPATLVGPSMAIPIPEVLKSLAVDCCLGVVIGGSGRSVAADQADGLVLGLALISSFYAVGERGGRSRDFGLALGPAITTPDELDDAVTEDERGRRYRFSISLRVNSEELLEFDLSKLPYTVAEYISHASETCALRQGDIIAVSLSRTERKLEKGDQVQALSDKLGALSTRLG